MTEENKTGVLEQARTRFRQIAEKESLFNVEVSILAKPLTPEEAIGDPGRRDFPIIIGKERVVEAMQDAERLSAFIAAIGEAAASRDVAKAILGVCDVLAFSDGRPSPAELLFLERLAQAFQTRQTGEPT